MKAIHWFFSFLFAGLLFALGFLLGERGNNHPPDREIIMEQTTTHKIIRRNLDDPPNPVLMRPTGEYSDPL